MPYALNGKYSSLRTLEQSSLYFRGLMVRIMSYNAYVYQQNNYTSVMFENK